MVPNMLKSRLLYKILQLSIEDAVLSILLLISIIEFFIFFGHSNYPSISEDELEKTLFKETHPSINAVNTKCTYNYIHDTKILTHKNLNEVLKYKLDGVINGEFMPSHCTPEFSVAILVTYRNRPNQLKIFLPYIHNFLKNQNIHYRIYVIEQQNDKPWNKGLLYNIGADLAIKDKYPCLILHDVDLLPLSTSGIYACTDQPRHMSAIINSLRYVLPYKGLVGGVMAIKSKQFQQVNGFSNKYLNWGGEDDDLTNRILSQNLTITRFPPKMSEYIMLFHAHEKKNRRRHSLLVENVGHYQEEGLNTISYESVNITNFKLYTLVGVKF